MTKNIGVFGIVYLKTDTRLIVQEREYLMQQAIEMRYSREKQRAVEVEDRFEGKVYTKRQTASFGSFTGMHFKAEIDIENSDGKAKLEFIVCHQGYIPPILMNPSDN